MRYACNVCSYVYDPQLGDPEHGVPPGTTFANLPAMLQVLPGCDLADVPVIVLTIDPCISCTER